MNKKHYFVSCPGDSFSGGPQLAHQLCRMLLDLGADAKMHYYQGTDVIADVDMSNTIFGKYNLDHVTSMDELDTKDSVVIFPETNWILAKRLKHASTHMWWMSVFYFEWTTGWYDDTVNDWFKNQFLKEDHLHLVQSKYAYDYCINTMKIPSDHVYYLTDYIDELYLTSLPESRYRKDYVFYNPAKMSRTQEILLSDYSDFNWIPIQNMSKAEINDKFRKGKVYVDFGHHPGKDRIPREAASCGCCIITNREGSADNDVDVPILDQYKFDNSENRIPEIVNMIKDCIDNYDTHIDDFANYRKWISEEKSRFKEEVKQFISLTNKGDIIDGLE